MIKKRATALLLLLLLLVPFALGYWLNKPTGEDALITIASGSSFREIGEQLHEGQLIRSSLLWQIVGFISRKNTATISGTYYFTSKMGMMTILDHIHRGDFNQKQIRLTVPEGSTIEQIAVYAGNTGLVTAEDFLEAAKKITRDDASSQVLFDIEGYLFPETYFLHAGITVETILEMMQNQFDLVLADIEIPKDFRYSLDELITIASIIEKESQDPEEIRLVAGVFLNRLDIDMALQSCATVNYILKQDKLVLTLEEIAIDSPYNTYLHPGLPPGPVGNPGRAAIEAVLNPEKSDYLFFVAGPNGKHHFSETYEEHQWWTQFYYGE